MVCVAKNNTPTLRFAGFDDEWGATQVGCIAARAIGGGTPSRAVPGYWDGGTPWIQSSDVKEHSVFGCTPKHFVSSRGLASSATSLVKGEALAVVTRVAVGKVAIMTEDYCSSQDFLNLSDVQGDLTFLGVLLKRELESISSQTQGTSIKGVTKEDVVSLNIHVPSLEEQRAIGELFSDLDALIKQHRAKHTNLQQTKTALLQRMFPQDGADEPELRLGGFSGAWETTEVKHIAARAIGGGTPSRTVDESWNGSIPWIQSSDVKERTVFGCTPKHFISSRGLASTATSLVKGGSLAIVTRVGVGKVAIMTEDYCSSQDFLNLSGLQGDLTFLGVLLQSELEEMSSQTQGTSIKGVTKEDVMSLSIQVPPALEEQRAIGEVLTNLDALISAEHQYITQLTQAKTALLQRMFV